MPYLGQLVAGLGAVLGATGPEVQELALSALASVVAAAGKEFEPYLGGCRWAGSGAMGLGWVRLERLGKAVRWTVYSRLVGNWELAHGGTGWRSGT